MPYHILGIEQIGLQRCMRILQHAREYRRQHNAQQLRGAAIALAFFEPSTRTRMSFERAAHLLGCHTVHFAASGSSLEKGESVAETIRTLDAIGFDAIVLRHRDSDAAEYAAQCSNRAAIVNAGDGWHEHPTQALLDALTLLDVFDTLTNKRIAIIGDILHSRVFRSDVALFRMLGAVVGVCAPPLLTPRVLPPELTMLPTAHDAVQWADAVVVLRLQRERMDAGYVPSLSDYRRRYALTWDLVESSRAVILHPGPVNIGIELDGELLSHPRSLIHQQVANGVFIRMAALADAIYPEHVEHTVTTC